MMPVLSRALDHAVTPRAPRPVLKCEDPLRIAAATLTQSRASEITATTVVGVLGLDDAAAFETLVTDISHEFSLEARIRLHVGSYSVRFSRRIEYNCGRCSSSGR